VGSDEGQVPLCSTPGATPCTLTQKNEEKPNCPVDPSVPFGPTPSYLKKTYSSHLSSFFTCHPTPPRPPSRRGDVDGAVGTLRSITAGKPYFVLAREKLADVYLR
jgi:hypothetical protein